MFQTLQPPDWAPAKGYSNGIVARGRTIFLAGMIGWNGQCQFESDDFVVQCRQALQNIIDTLACAQAGPEHVVRMTWYVTDKQEYLRRARIGNSSLQLVSGIFRGEELLVGGELVYVFADPVAKVSLPVPQILRDLLTGFEQGESPVRTVLGDWQSLREAVCSLRTADDQDAQAQHCVLYNAMNEAIACGRLALDADPQVDGLFVSPLLRGAGWSRVVRQHLNNEITRTPESANKV